MDEDQKDLMRFLWIDNIDSKDPHLVTYRYKTVLFGMACSPFCLNATLAYHIKNYYADNEEMANKILSCFFVDDWTGGGSNYQEVIDLYKEAKSCLADGGFNLRKWASNCNDVIETIASCNAENSAEKNLNLDGVSYAKTSVGGLHEIEGD